MLKRMFKQAKKKAGLRKRRNRLTFSRSLVGNAIHKFVRTTQSLTIANDPTLPKEYIMTFTLDSLLNYTEFTNLFDAYRIVGVSVQFIPIVSGEPNSMTVSAVVAPYVVTAIDHDDANPINAPPYEYPSCQTNSMVKGFTRVLKPLPAMTVFNTSTSSGYARPSRDQWLDTAYPRIPHYSLRCYIPDASAYNYAYRTLVTYSIECKSTK